MTVAAYADRAGPPATAARTTPAPSQPTGTASPLVAVRAYLAGRIAPEDIAPDAKLEAPGVPGELRGRAAIVGYWTTFAGAFAERELAVVTAFEAGDRAVVVLRLRGVHRRRLLGHAPTGRRLDLPMVAFAQVDAGRIRHLQLSSDRLALAEHLREADPPG